MTDQPQKPVFTGKPPGRKLPPGIKSATHSAMPLVAPQPEPPVAPIDQQPETVMPAPLEPALPKVVAVSKPEIAPQVLDEMRHKKTLLAAALIVMTVGAVTGVVLANLVRA